MQVPCGKCPMCLKAHAAGWAFRLAQELKVSSSAYFITLTYDTQRVPINRSGYMCLYKRHLQLFFKRLRKSHSSIPQHSRTPIKYYAIGEYGGTFNRPHYHILLFNARLDRLFSGKDIQKLRLTNFDGKAHVYAKHWTNGKRGSKAKVLGFASVGRVEGASIGYCMKYISEPCPSRTNKKSLVTKAFATMSKGLGISYLTPQMINYHKKGLEKAYFGTLTDGTGRKVALPRYYKDRIFTSKQKEDINKHWTEKDVDRLLEDILKGVDIIARKKGALNQARKMHSYRSKQNRLKQKV